MNEKLTEFIQNSEKYLEEITTDLESEKIKILKFFREEVLDKIEMKNIIIQDRIKGTDSLREKIIRKNYFQDYEDSKEFINNLPDLIGIRLVCLSNKEESILFNELEKLFSKEKDSEFNIIEGTEKKGEYIQINIKGQPDTQKNGHKIYKMDAKWINSGQAINIELQIKSLIHTFWGEVDHMLFYKNYSYMINEDFYKGFMESTFKILQNVDYQLESMKEQMKIRNEEEQVIELKEMSARILYNTYKSDALELFKCNIDLKEAFELIASIYFKKITDKTQALSCFSSIVSKINLRNSTLDENKYKFEEYKIEQCRLDNYSKKWVEQLLVLLNSEDVFWGTFFAVYKIIKDNCDIGKLIEEIALELSSFFYEFNEEFEEGIEEIAEICINALRNAVLESFKIYKKLDFFCESVHLGTIKNQALRFIREIKEDIYALEGIEHTKEEKQKIYDLISSVSTIKILANINVKIKIEQLQRLKELLDDNNNIMGNLITNININMLNEQIKKNKVVISFDEYTCIFKEGSEKQDEKRFC